MEFLRFGSSIPGTYWGCCACCIIQNFNVDPDAKSSIQLVSGDGGQGITGKNGKVLFAGPTYRDIFHQRIRSGTFDKRDMPNHAFLAIITRNQINGPIGKKWLAILKEAGFEFVRGISNSVYQGQALLGDGKPTDGSANYMFGLFRNIGSGALADPFTPPKEWTDLPSVKTEFWEYPSDAGSFEPLTASQRAADTAIWEKIGPPTFLTEEEVVAAGAPVVYAGKRSLYPQQPKEMRESIEKTQLAKLQPPAKEAVAVTGSLKANPAAPLPAS